MRISSKGQSIFEYVMILAIVVAGLMSMQIYMKRAVEGRLRASMDEVGELYSPGKTTSIFVTEQIGEIKEIETFGLLGGTKRKDGVSITKVLTPSEVHRSASGTVAGSAVEKVDIDFATETLF